MRLCGPRTPCSWAPAGSEGQTAVGAAGAGRHTSTGTLQILLTTTVTNAEASVLSTLAKQPDVHLAMLQCALWGFAACSLKGVPRAASLRGSWQLRCVGLQTGLVRRVQSAGEAGCGGACGRVCAQGWPAAGR